MQTVAAQTRWQFVLDPQTDSKTSPSSIGIFRASPFVSGLEDLRASVLGKVCSQSWNVFPRVLWASPLSTDVGVHVPRTKRWIYNGMKKEGVGETKRERLCVCVWGVCVWGWKGMWEQRGAGLVLLPNSERWRTTELVCFLCFLNWGLTHTLCTGDPNTPELESYWRGAESNCAPPHPLPPHSLPWSSDTWYDPFKRQHVIPVCAGSSLRAAAHSTFSTAGALTFSSACRASFSPHSSPPLFAALTFFSSHHSQTYHLTGGHRARGWLGLVFLFIIYLNVHVCKVNCGRRSTGGWWGEDKKEEEGTVLASPHLTSCCSVWVWSSGENP